MSETDPGVRPRTAASTSDDAVAEAFALLGDGTRLDILLAIWESHDPSNADNSVPFSQIFERVEYDDPGNLRYHLQKLEGQFLRQHDEGEGYELRVPAQQLVRAIIAGAGVHDERLEPTPIDEQCPFCGAGTKVSFREGILFWACHECDGMTPGRDFAPFDPPGPLMAVQFDPAGLGEWTAEELRAAMAVHGRRRTRSMFAGLCPTCSGPVEARFEWCESHDPDGCHACGTRWKVKARFRCHTCANYGGTSPKRLVMFHPTVASLYHEHGIPTWYRVAGFERVRELNTLTLAHEVALVSTDPVRVEVTVSLDEDVVRVTFDENVRFLDVERD